MQKIKLRNRKPYPRAAYGHPWVFKSEIEELLPSEYDGQGVICLDRRGEIIGSGIYNSQSNIVWRRYSFVEEEFDRLFLEYALTRAAAGRKGESCCRLVWSEADNLPGLVVDRYNSRLVVQAFTKAMDIRIKDICSILVEKFNPEAVLIRNDAPSRKHEGLLPNIYDFHGNSGQEETVEIEGMKYCLSFKEGNKTGFYIDQRKEHLYIGALSAGRRVLDGFCSQGAFSLNCARSGAVSVTGVDISSANISRAVKNARLNGLKAEFIEYNMFDYFSDNKDKKFDMIILDPPSFARNRKALEGALRGYKELNLRAFKMLSTGGILATYSCSQSIDIRIFEKTVAQAAHDAGRRVRILRRAFQPEDHPVILGIPETEYLKGLVLVAG